MKQGNSNLLDDIAKFNKGSANKFSLYRTSCRLYLKCVDLSDAGNYTCVAETEDFRKERKITLTVDNLVKIYMKTLSVVEAPGNDVRLFCRAIGSPDPGIQWCSSNTNATIENNDKYK
ncbi:neuronal cell adhesion molecule [Plakobranchus ocellatus]|uniref:Neuronal cell adhesion molecule n=1 Tax=Plakobranchus ocellatus TaxID=259542 RepID=A0AAV3ZZJ9_9GAST|nr:neuronal cell adhesion molecule [Plakobranchus ocellatus]